MKVFVGILISIGTLLAQATVDVPAGTAPARRLLAHSAGTWTTGELRGVTAAHNLSVNDRVWMGLVYVTGSPDPVLANVNGAYRIASVPTASTFTLKELANENAVTLTGTYLANSGLVSQSGTASLVDHPRGPYFDGRHGAQMCRIAASIKLGNLANVSVSGNTATINFTSCTPGFVATRTKVSIRNASDGDLNGEYTVQTTPTSTSATITVANVTAATYTDANLAVSAVAVTGNNAWSGINAQMTSFSTTSRTATSVVNADNWDVGAFLFAAVVQYLVDPSNTTARDYALTALRLPRRLFPMQQLRYSGSAQRNYYSDNARMMDGKIASAFSAMHALGELTGGEETTFAEAVLKDTDTDGSTCTYRTVPANASGTITVTPGSGSTATVAGVDTAFTTEAPVGSFLSITSGIETAFAEVTAVASDNSLTVARGTDFSGTAVAYKSHPAYASGDCGRFWLLGNLHGGASFKEDRRYPDKSSMWSLYRWLHTSGNNQGYTASLPYLAYGEALAGIDSRAAYWYSTQAHMHWTYHLYDVLAGGSSEATKVYENDRTAGMRHEMATQLQNTDSVLMDSLAPYIAQMVKDVAMTFIFGFPAVGQPANAWVAAPTAGGEVLAGAISEHMASMLRGPYAFGSAETKWVDWLIKNQWSSFDPSGNNTPYINSQRVAWYRPDTEPVDYRSVIPLQWSGGGENQTAAVCAALRIECLDRPKNLFAYSRSGFSAATDWTILVEAQAAEEPLDYVNFTQGSYKLFVDTAPTSSTAFTRFLFGSNGSSGGSPVAGTAVSEANSFWYSPAITNQTASTGVGPDGRTRWSGTARTGDPTNRYFALSVSATRAWQNNGLTPTLPDRASRHFYNPKGAGRNPFLFIYSTTSWGGGNSMQHGEQFRVGNHTVSFTGGVVTVTNSNNHRAITQWIAPAGANTIALVDQGVNGSEPHTRLIRVCGSVDGSTCANVTAHESLQVSLLTTNATSAFTLTQLTPSSEITGALAEGASSAALYVVARNDAMVTSVPATSVTLPAGKTTQILIAGLTAGAYSVTLGGTEVFTCAVATGDQTCYGEVTGSGSATDIAIVEAGALATGGSVRGGGLRGGTLR